jgi:hypothetical protein
VNAELDGSVEVDRVRSLVDAAQVQRDRGDELAEAARRDFQRGLESGFPLCCVIFFIGAWSPGPWADWKAAYSAKLHALPGGSPGYVPCPVCLAKIAEGSFGLVEPHGSDGGLYLRRQAAPVAGRNPATPQTSPRGRSW